MSSQAAALATKQMREEEEAPNVLSGRLRNDSDKDLVEHAPLILRTEDACRGNGSRRAVSSISYV